MNKTIYIFKIQECLKFLEENISSNIYFSRKGIIKLGDFLSVQRKGGNGSHITIPKTNWQHPGNQLQFKFSPLRFAEYIAKENLIDYCKIDYNF
jgi:hypothetical protein